MVGELCAGGRMDSGQKRRFLRHKLLSRIRSLENETRNAKKSRRMKRMKLITKKQNGRKNNGIV